jgi:hypothetical protein
VSARRQTLIRVCQALNRGSLCDCRLENADPVLEGSSILSEERLDLVEEARSEIQLEDFNLTKEWLRLFSRFDAIRNGHISRVTVIAGIPRRVIFESRMPKARP